MAIETITAAQYARLAPKVDANQAAMRSGPNPRDLKTHPYPFPRIGNAEASKVEQYRILHNPPESLYAYVKGRTVTTWCGDVLGYCRPIGDGWRVSSYVGSRMFAYTATIAGREYHGRSFGEGMAIGLRETAASKRKRSLNPYSQAGRMVARVAGLAAWNHTAAELRNIKRARRNGYGLRLAFRDGSAAFIPAGTARAELVK